MKKLIFTIFAVGSISSTIFAQTAPVITAWIRNTTNATGYTGLPANVQSVYYTTTDVYVSASGIPSYTIGPWNNPNVATQQTYKAKFTRTPTPSGTTFTGLGAIGLWTDGTAIYNQKDGQYWNTATGAFTNGTTNTGWNRNALYFEGGSFDNCLGHAGPNGGYHNHVNPQCLYDKTASTVHSPIIGYAFDGYPIYGPYGYTNTNGTGAIKRMVSSYALSTAASRTNGPAYSYVSGGKTCVLGSMCEDYVYTAGSGDLDARNGRTCITPEYPSGTYAYFLTLDASLAPAYPFIVGLTYNGVATTGTNQTIPAGATLYTGSSLPVELFGFTVQLKDKNSAFVSWKVGTEINVDDYQLERSIDAQTFDLVGVIKAEKKSYYQFVDKNLGHGNYYYRLKTVDKDGTFNYSSIASLAIKNGQSILIHNNPAQDVLVVQSDDALVERTIGLYNVEGKLMEQKTAEQGITMLAFDVQTLYAGTYIVRISNGKDVKTTKVVIGH
jgi:YHYH protein/Secretion system C-terminal sorting domain